MARSKLAGPYRNRLLAALSAADLALLAPHLTHVSFQRRKQLAYPDRKMDAVYFVEQGIVSVVAVTGDQESEVGIIGCEGMSGISLALGTDRSPLSIYVQVSGTAQRLPVEILRNLMRQSDNLRNLLLMYAQTFMVQAAYSVAAAARSTLEVRLARWLLMAHDRVDGDEIPLTHEFLALMLGVRRPGVTQAMQALARAGLIEAGRGRVVLLNRKALEKLAGKFYGEPEKEYDRLIG